jgi:hypothetical protein
VQSRARRQKRSTVRWASTRAQETLSLGRCATPMMFRSLINAPKYLLLRVLNWWSGCGGATACKYVLLPTKSRQWSGQRHVSDLFPSLPPDRAPHRIIRPWQPLSCYDTSSIITQQARAIHLWSWASSCDFLRLGIAKIQRSKLLLSSSLIARRASINPHHLQHRQRLTISIRDSRLIKSLVSCLTSWSWH